jgi:serine/threonine protein phosphatase PrpC
MGTVSTIPKGLKIRAAGLTDIGCVRERNEDAFLVDIQSALFIVADGMGGHDKGDVAARMAIELLPGIINRHTHDIASARVPAHVAIRRALTESVKELSRHLYEKGRKSLESRAMGTTVVAVLIAGRHIYIANMGDSRAYLLRQGKLLQLTEDHSITAMLLRHGEITPKEAEVHPGKAQLTRFVGMKEEVAPDVQSLKLQLGDRLLLCTDGLWATVTEAKMSTILTGCDDAGVVCRDLVAAGKEAGGQDNLTAVVVNT